MCRVVTKKFTGRDPSLTTRARHWLTSCLGLLEVASPMQTAELLVSELVTNAICHGGGSPTITVSVRGSSLEVGVTDDDSHLPVPVDHQHARSLSLDLTAECGRGLAIVDALASEWGAAITGRGKQVWFRLSMSEWPHVSDCDCESGEGTRLPSGRGVHAIPGPWDN